MAAPTAGVGDERASLVRAGGRVELVTVVWMVIEAVVASGAGVLAASVLLTAFGIDSVIELVTGGVLLWQLATEARDGSLERVERVERAENRAAWVTGVGLVLLCLYVVAGVAFGLLTRSKPEGSPVGIGLSIAALVIMPLLAWRKRTIAARLDSAVLRGDATCSITCAYMADALLVGLALNAVCHLPPVPGRSVAQPADRRGGPGTHHCAAHPPGAWRRCGAGDTTPSPAPRGAR